MLPETVHPAFNKAAKLMDLEVRRVPVGADFRADVAALDAAIDADTIMLVGSAPNFPYGSIDPIVALGRLAEKKRVWLHVDACVGGYLAPFVAIVGATAGANLALLGLDIVWDRQSHDRRSGAEAREALEARPSTL